VLVVEVAVHLRQVLRQAHQEHQAMVAQVRLPVFPVAARLIAVAVAAVRFHRELLEMVAQAVEQMVHLEVRLQLQQTQVAVVGAGRQFSVLWRRRRSPASSSSRSINKDNNGH
jgi:hypothetical protein